MNQGIDLMIFFLKDEDLNKEEMGINVPFEDCELRLLTFYRIDWISIHSGNSDFTSIGSNGDEFICNERYDIIKNRIESVNTFLIN